MCCEHAQSTNVRQLIQKIENHPDRHALQQDLRQNQSFNPFSPESEQLIQDVGNIELCELLETEPKTQCTVCLSYWSIGILYCTCGHFLHKERGDNQKFIRYTMDLLSVPEYVIKKGRLHGHRYGKKPGDKEYFTANNNGHRVLLLHGGIGKVHGGLFILPKVTMEMHQVLNERSDLLIAVFGKILRDKTFMNSIYFVTDGSFTADGGLLYPTGCVNTTPQMTRFRGAKVCSKWLQERIHDHNIQSDYKCTFGLKVHR